MIEFLDFQCPACTKFETTARQVREVLSQNVTFGLIYLPLPQHEYGESAIAAAECARVQGQLERMITELFDNQQSFGAISWVEYAKSSGVPDIDAFETCIRSIRLTDRINANRRLADKFGVRGTPTIVVNGWRLPFQPSIEDFEVMVRNVAADKEPIENFGF